MRIASNSRNVRKQKQRLLYSPTFHENGASTLSKNRVVEDPDPIMDLIVLFQNKLVMLYIHHCLHDCAYMYVYEAHVNVYPAYQLKV